MTCALFRPVFWFGATSQSDTKGFSHGPQHFNVTRQRTQGTRFLAWHVANKGDKAHWTKVGAAWFHRDRQGLSLQLEVVPINGRIVLRTPLDDNDQKAGA